MDALTVVERTVGVAGSLAAIVGVFVSVYFGVRKKNKKRALAGALFAAIAIAAVIIVVTTVYPHTEFDPEAGTETSKPAIDINMPDISRDDTLELIRASEPLLRKAEELGIRVNLSAQMRAPQTQGEILLLLPYRKTRVSNPSFWWSPAAGIERVKLMVSDSVGRTIWETDESGTTATYDADPLARGQTYFWRVEALPGGMAVSGDSYFELLSEEEEHELSAHLNNVAQLRTQDLAALPREVARGAVLLAFGLLDEARIVLEQATDTNPHDARVLNLLGYVYDELGWYWQLSDEDRDEK